MKILSGLTGTINSLTSVVIALLGLGIVVSLLGGNVPFVGGVADNIVGLVQSLGDAGIVGLIAATRPTIPASPKPCTKSTILSATPPTNGTFPPSRETTIPKANKAITTLVRL